LAEGHTDISASGGTNALNAYGEEKDIDDPVPIYLRGMYFDGTDDFMTVTGIVVSLTHTI